MRKHHKSAKHTPKPKAQPLAVHLVKYGTGHLGNTIFFILQTQNDFLEVDSEQAAKLWGAAIGKPCYLTFDDQHSKN